MDNNKKQQQNYGRSINAKPSVPAESNRKSSDLQVNKQRNSRRREQISTPRNDQQRHFKQQQQQQQLQPAKLRPNVDKRPRPLVGGSNVTTSRGIGLPNAANDNSSCSSDDYVGGSTGLASAANYRHEQFDYELDTHYYEPGGRKRNLNHLLNFHYKPREGDYSVFGRGGNHRSHHNTGSVRTKRFNKEQFLQANFQFVIRSSAKPEMTASPDTLIDWSLIEQINIQTTEEPQCPICLYPPVAAKLTRCGHAYCWPCMLHYLSLSDKSWRKCPICDDPIHATDLKSCTIMQQRSINLHDEITFQLMRRRKGSMYIERFSALNVGSGIERFPLMSRDDEAKQYSKFVIARRADILGLIEREHRELMSEEDSTCPEYVFIQQALIMLNERRDKLGCLDFKEDVDEDDFTTKHNDETVLVNKEEKNFTTFGAHEQISNENAEFAEEHSNETSSVEEESVDSNEAIVDETNAAAATADAPFKYYYFYQSNDGQNIYLHPLNVKMLQACYGALDHAPLIISARILQKEHHSMDEDHRRKFTCLGHLPLTCQFAVVEVELNPPVVTGGILKLFKDDLQRRKQERQRREREERKREKHINELNDRQMGKLIASTANINLSSAQEFPTCGFEETLPTISEQRYGAAAVASNSASYSSVAVVGESPKQREFWPTIGGGGGGSSAPSSAINSPTFNEFGVGGGGAWGRAAPPPPKPIVVKAKQQQQQTEDVDGEFRPMTTRLCDVLAEAISQKQQKSSNGNGNGAGSKKQKKSKKMTPIFATGMNYNGK